MQHAHSRSDEVSKQVDLFGSSVALIEDRSLARNRNLVFITGEQLYL